jgi:hypothetical protein
MRSENRPTKWIDEAERKSLRFSLGRQNNARIRPKTNLKRFADNYALPAHNSPVQTASNLRHSLNRTPYEPECAQKLIKEKRPTHTPVWYPMLFDLSRLFLVT